MSIAINVEARIKRVTVTDDMISAQLAPHNQCSVSGGAPIQTPRNGLRTVRSFILWPSCMSSE
jgi:hypothetical protein